MTTFVRYFELFNDPTPNRQLIFKKLSDSEKYTINSINTKISVGLKIIKNGHAIPALEIISKSSGVKEKTRLQAQEILKILSGF